MNIKKIVSCFTAAAMSVAAFAVSAVSVSAADSVSCKLYTQNTNSWTVYESDAFDISSDGGDYTVSVNAGGETDYITLYIKDVAGANAPASFAEGTLTVNSIKVNGKKLGLTKTDYELVGDTGVLDVCFINGWAESFVTADEAAFDSSSSSSYTYGEAVDTFEVSFSVNFGGAAAETEAPAETEAATETEAAVEETEAPAETEAPVEETTVEETEAPAETEAPVEEVVEEAPVADTTTDAAATGNTAAVSIVAVMAVAGAAALISKRK